MSDPVTLNIGNSFGLTMPTSEKSTICLKRVVVEYVMKDEMSTIEATLNYDTSGEKP